MFVTADQVFAHMVADYVLQSEWMALEKTKSWTPAAVHASIHGLVFLTITQSPAAIAIIILTHFAVDHWRLARYVCWAKNWLAPRELRGGIEGDVTAAPGTFSRHDIGHQLRGTGFAELVRIDRVAGDGTQAWVSSRIRPNKPWADCSATGFDPDRPIWMSLWLMIIVDNVMHVACNATAIRLFG